MYRPIPPGGNDLIDRVYPYGGTQRGVFQVHSGVEFFNPRFTPVIAADTGVVAFAGDDLTEVVGKQPNYYGNVVIIQHDTRPPEGQMLYTLYGHLEDYMVEVGQVVARGEQIGRVGATGIALGAHLHFEVRINDGFDFYSTRNPDLYLYPQPDTAMLVGLVRDIDGNPLPEVPILIRRAGGGTTYETYSYGAEVTNPSNVWGENFTRGDIRPGEYDILITTFFGQVVFRQTVTLEEDNATWVEAVIPAGLQFYPSLNSQSADQFEDYPTLTPSPFPPGFTPSPSPTAESFG